MLRQFEELKQERAAERAEMDEMIGGRAAEEAAREAPEPGAKEAIHGRSEPALQQPRLQGQDREQGYRSHTGTSIFISQNSM